MSTKTLPLTNRSIASFEPSANFLWGNAQTAIDANKRRLGSASEQIRWLVADITKRQLEPCAYDVWHDRAVFHFLTALEERIAYVREVANAVKPGGHVIVSTFGPEGPTKCSGLDVVRYDAESLHQEFGVRFPLVGELQGTASHTVRHNPAVSLLFLQGGMKEIPESILSHYRHRWPTSSHRTGFRTSSPDPEENVWGNNSETI